VVDVLERDGDGLNLTEQVRDGILNHTGSRRAGDAGGADRQAGRPRRLHQPRHRRRLRAGILRPRSAGAEIELLGPTGSQRIDTLVRDIAENSSDGSEIVQSREIGGAMLRLRKFMFDRVYLGPEARREHERVQRTVRGLVGHYLDHPGELPEWGPGADECQRVTDYVAGMTDRFCIAKFTELTIPAEARF
jgi:dGTPase